jgi:predicted Fe-Mo cluster-binding NifX family protein
VAVQAGLNTLNAMFQAGVQVSQAHQQGLNEILKSLSGGKPN